MGSGGPLFQQGSNSQRPFQGNSAHVNNLNSFPPQPTKRFHTGTEPSSLIHDDPKAAALYAAFINHVKTLYRLIEIEKRAEVLKLYTPGNIFINLAFIDRKTEGLWKSSDGSKTEYDEKNRV